MGGLLFLLSFLSFSSLGVKAYVCCGGVLSVWDESFAFLRALLRTDFSHGEEKQTFALETAWEPTSLSKTTQIIGILRAQLQRNVFLEIPSSFFTRTYRCSSGINSGSFIASLCLGGEIYIYIKAYVFHISFEYIFPIDFPFPRHSLGAAGAQAGPGSPGSDWRRRPREGSADPAGTAPSRIPRDRRFPRTREGLTSWFT